MKKKNLTLVIMGRSNVGKSTLFNRLISKRRSLVHNQPGVTRDRVIVEDVWCYLGKFYPIRVVDTGGLGTNPFAQQIEHQIKLALKEADVVLWVMDSQVGPTYEDSEGLMNLKKSGFLHDCQIFGVINKVDTQNHELKIVDFFSLGFKELLTISAEHNRGIEDLKSKIFQSIPCDSIDLKQATQQLPRVTIVGRPNVGKSTLMNTLSQEERVICSDLPGTTVDCIDLKISLFTQEGPQDFVLVDTAGIRRKNKTQQGIEVLSVIQVKKALQKSDFALFMIDGQQGLCDQDQKIGNLIEESGCGVILLVNKWDTQKSKIKASEAANRIRNQIPFLRYAPLLFVSAKENFGLDSLGDLFLELLNQQKKKIPSRELTLWVQKAIEAHPSGNAKCYWAHQSGHRPVRFVFHVNHPNKIHASLKKYIINGIRECWGLIGYPIQLSFVSKSKHLPSK